MSSPGGILILMPMVGLTDEASLISSLMSFGGDGATRDSNTIAFRGQVARAAK